MKKIYLSLFACLIYLGMNSATFSVNISGFSYAPASLTVAVGDVITIQASATHPLVQVDGGTWNAGGTASLTGGWGVKTADYTFTVSTVGSIYYLCQVHGPSGMKGQLTVIAAAGVNENSNFINNLILFPNPANNKMTVNFGLTTASQVSAKLMNLLGQEVAVLIPNTKLPADNYSYTFELPAAMPDGAYFAVITSNDRRVTKKVVVNK